ncbi:unnamed protein product [Heligmosomoides polygyrus]|uniref:TROVE domain-containing protein n=1 Tax=Heligmosomoides polygyrus TaxID=6339 RepID=A0A183F4H8_HELPZ|nr:unnamed protein product [Heligmosomoides polygyrus]
MPRFMESQKWSLLNDIPANFSRLVMEALSLRQKVVLARQALHFLRRCQRNDVIPTFITSKKLHETCGLPKDDKKLREIENDILKMTIKSKQNNLYSLLLKCVSKEQSCERFLPDRLWRRIVGLMDKKRSEENNTSIGRVPYIFDRIPKNVWVNGVAIGSL